MHNLDSISSEQLREQADQLELAGETLSAAAAKIREAAEVLDTLANQNGQASVQTVVAGKTRPEQLWDWLSARGHMRRKDIIEQGPMPRGTISVALREENGFAKDEEGLWYAEEDEVEEE